MPLGFRSSRERKPRWRARKPAPPACGYSVALGDTANAIDDSSGGGGENGEEGGAIRSQGNLTIINSAITGNATGAGGDAEYDRRQKHGDSIWPRCE